MENANTETMGQMGAWAPYYDLLMKVITLGRERILRQMTVRLAPVRPEDRVLEVGCGTGTLSLAAWKQAGSSGKVYGIDVAPEMIAVARRKATRAGAEVDFQVGSMDHLPFPDDQFDVGLCSFMIFHVPEAVRRRGVAEIRRVLRPGGHLLIVDSIRPPRPSLIGWLVGSGLPQDLRALLPAMQEAGFTDIETGPTSFNGVAFVRGSKSAEGSE